MDVTELADRLAIADLLTAYTRAVDTGNFEALHEVFTPDAVMDYSSVGGPVGPPAEVVPWVAEGLAGFARVQHLLGQLDVRLDGDRAEVTAYFTNPMVAVAPDGTESLFECGGYYHHRLIKTAAGWRSVSLVDDVLWSRGF